MNKLEEVKVLLNLLPKDTVDNNKVQQIKDFANKIANTYEAKNADYGDSFGKLYKEYGHLGIVTATSRIGDKYNRLKNYSFNYVASIISGSKEDLLKVKDETPYDTLIDMASYCLMTILELKEQLEK